MFSQRNKVQTRKSAAAAAAGGGGRGKRGVKIPQKLVYTYRITALPLYPCIRVKHPFVSSGSLLLLPLAAILLCRTATVIIVIMILCGTQCIRVFILPKTGDYYWLSVRVPTGLTMVIEKKKKTNRTVIYGRTQLTGLLARARVRPCWFV